MNRYYDYKCNSCSHREERLLGATDDKDSQRCPVCNSYMQRLFNYSGMYTIHGNNSGSTPPKSKVKR